MKKKRKIQVEKKKNAKLGNDVVPNYCAAYLIKLKMCKSMTVFISTCIAGPHQLSSCPISTHPPLLTENNDEDHNLPATVAIETSMTKSPA